MYLTDYHTHSRLSFDSTAPLPHMVHAARQAGLRELCVTDHCDFLTEQGAPSAHFDWDSAIAQYDEVRQTLAGTDFTLRLGLELGMPHLNPAAAAAICAQPRADFILGSVHNQSPGQGGVDLYYLDYTRPEACYAALDDYFASLDALARTDFYDVLAHIIYPLRYMPEGISLADYTDRMEAIFRAAAQRGRGMEVNTCRGRTVEAWRPVLALFRACGGEIITLGSDAHDPSGVGKGLAEACALVKASGFRYIATYEKHIPHFHTI